MTLFLHLGPSKTASTLGQAIFGAARSDGSVVYPEAGRRPGRPVHHRLADVLRHAQGDAAGLAAAGLPEILAALERGSVLLSSENFPAGPRFLEPLIGPARRMGHDVTVFFVVRDPVMRLNSMYNQVVKTFRQRVSFAEFLARRPYEKRLYPRSGILVPWRRAGCTIRLWRYRSRDMAAVYARMARAAGLEPQAVQDEVVNPSLSAAGIRLLLTHFEALNVPGYMRALVEADRALGLGPHFGFGPAETADLLAHLGDEYAGLPFEDETPAEAARPALDASYPPRDDTPDPAVLEAYAERVFGRLARVNPGWQAPRRG